MRWPIVDVFGQLILVGISFAIVRVFLEDLEESFASFQLVYATRTESCAYGFVDVFCG